MSKDIRSYFLSKGNSQTKNVKEDKPRKAAVISSDEDEKNSSPAKSKKLKTTGSKNAGVNGRKVHSKKRTIVSSDEDEDLNSQVKAKKAKVLNGNKTASTESKLEVVEDVSTVFSKKPVKRVNAPKVNRKAKIEKAAEPIKKSVSSFIEDDDFDATLNQLDTSQFEDEYLATITNETSSQHFKETKETKRNDSKKEEKTSKVKESTKEEKNKEKPASSKSKEVNKDKRSPRADKNESKEKNDSEHSEHKNNKEKLNMDCSEIQQNAKDKKKSKEIDYNDIIEEKVEKKKQHALLYQSYLNRGGARNPGSKEIPEGAEHCLANSTFLITGVLDSLERSEAEDIIKKYGGKVVSSVSKKLNYMIVGEEAGPSKLAKAESLNIKRISEDGFLELIRSRSAELHNKKPTEESCGSHKRKRDESSESTEQTKRKHDSPKKSNHKSPEKANEKKDDISIEKKRSPEKSKKTKNILSPKKNQSSENGIEKHPSPKNKIESFDEVQPKIECKNDILQTQSSTSDLKVDITGDALVEKYRPKELKQIIGQTGDKSNAKKLHNWLTNWHKNHGKDAKGTKPKFSYKDDTGTIYKAALLSGPPGIGKTTTAYVVCAQLGYEILEFNASDTRSKKLLQGEIAGILSNKTVKSFLTNAAEKKKDPPKHVLLMDEVDGMAGNEDRGGMQELIAFIKSTEVPIICICNDRMSQKIKTLANYTFDLRFQKPRLEQIRAAMMSLCFKEGIKVSTPELTAIIQSTNQDIRQVINHVAMLSAKSITEDESHEKTKYKNLKLGPWDVVRKVFSADEHKNMSIHDKSDLFFHDYNIASLFVEENYLSITPSGPRNELFDKLAKCSNSLAIGDTIENSIRGRQAWGLLPVQACFSSVIPGSIMSGFINSQINFPSWLGRNSKRSKCDRLLQDITVHARITTGASKESINLDYIKMLVDSIVRPLAVEGTEGVEKAVEVMNKYHLSREDLDSLIELTKWPHTRDPMQSVDTKTKTAFTKAYNKSASFHSATTMKKKSSRAAEDDELVESDQEPTSDADEDDDNIQDDKLIKAKTTKSKPSKASTESKGKTKGAAKSNVTRGKKK